MITISIVAIISAVGITSFSQSQKLGRDAKRKQDLRAIAIALELYKQVNGYYPKASPLPSGCTTINYLQNALYCYSNNASSPGTWIPALTTNYINSLPKDPAGDTGDPNSGLNGYAYMASFTGCEGGSVNTDGKYYLLFTRLENTSDPDRLGVNDKALCPSFPSLAAMGFGANLFVVTSY